MAANPWNIDKALMANEEENKQAGEATMSIVGRSKSHASLKLVPTGTRKNFNAWDGSASAYLATLGISMRTQEDFNALDAPKKAKCREVILFTISKTLMNKCKVAEQLRSGSNEMIKGQDIDPRKFYVWYGERNAAYQKTAVPAIESRMLEAVRAMRADPAPGQDDCIFQRVQ